MLNCLLVASSKTTSGFEYFTNLPNGGLASLAGNVNKEICNVKILDLVAVRHKPLPFFKNYIAKNHFDIIGFSCMVFQFIEILELAKLAKQTNPGVITLLGGYYATVCRDELINSEDINYFDFVITGEGEIPFRKLIDELNGNHSYETIPGLTYKRDGKIFSNPPGAPADLATLNLPDRSARIFKKQFKFLNYPTEVSETSRGCTYDCNFCSITKMYGTSYRKFPIERIIEDIKDARARGTKAILFTDDNITLNSAHFENVCRAIIENRLNDIQYLTQGSVKGFHDNPRLPALVAKAGFKWIFLGIESYSDETLKFFKKDNQLKTTDAESVIKSLQDEGIFVFGGFILGNPHDNLDTIKQAYEFAGKINVDLPIFLSLTPYPGTKLREELLEKNYITNLNDYSKYDNYQVNIRTDYLGSFELFEAIDSIIQKYMVDSGTLLRIIKKYPLFFLKSFFNFLYYHPDMIFHHLTKGRFLKNARKRKFG